MPDTVAGIENTLRDFLIAEGIVRNPRNAGELPPCWLNPENGLPRPGEAPPGGQPAEAGASMVVGLVARPGVLHERHVQRSIVRRNVDVQARLVRPGDGYALDVALQERLADRRSWLMAGVEIIESLLVRPWQPVASEGQGATRNSLWVCEYSFELWNQVSVSWS